MLTRENELLRKIAKGETEYWEELIGMYYEDIFRYCIYHAPDKAAAEDAVQETFLKVIRYMPDYRHRGKFRAFLYKVAANTCKDQWRKCAREEWFDVDSEASEGEKKLPGDLITVLLCMFAISSKNYASAGMVFLWYHLLYIKIPSVYGNAGWWIVILLIAAVGETEELVKEVEGKVWKAVLLALVSYCKKEY